VPTVWETLAFTVEMVCHIPSHFSNPKFKSPFGERNKNNKPENIEYGDCEDPIQ
jgi:hypothetical protein